MKKLSNKGFTLIELLAVVVIMGILMIVAIPAVTKYINNSKKDVFADTASAYINAARYSLLNDEYDCQAPDNNNVVYIPLYLNSSKEHMTDASRRTITGGRLSNIDIDKGNGKSTYNYDYSDGSYISVSNSNGKLVYSICLIDTEGNGISTITEESNLSRAVVNTKKSDAKCSIPNNPTPTICKKETS